MRRKKIHGEQGLAEKTRGGGRHRGASEKDRGGSGNAGSWGCGKSQTWRMLNKGAVGDMLLGVSKKKKKTRANVTKKQVEPWKGRCRRWFKQREKGDGGGVGGAPPRGTYFMLPQKHKSGTR